ncbi:MAG: hypothetical protein JWO30_2308 [Fibrobacteres bacterium]|nr:hypothetical protein [Fibrobacterota bacterium]
MDRPANASEPFGPGGFFRKWMMESNWKSESRASPHGRGTARLARGFRSFPGLLPPMVTLTLLLAGLASGGARTWTGGGPNDLWSSPGNWGGTGPISTDTLVFTGFTRLTPVNDLTPGSNFAAITFTGSAGPFSISGNAINLSGGAEAINCNVTSGTMSIGLPITFITSPPNINTVVGGALTLGGTISPGSLALTVNSAGNTQLNGVISGTGSITKSGNGVLFLNGSNTFSGAVSVSAGILGLGNPSALGTTAAGTTVSTGAAMDLNGLNYSASEALTINGAGPGSTGALVNSSATTAVWAGSLTLGSASSIIGQSGSITLANTGNISGAANGLTLGGSAGGTLASIWGGTGTLTKVNSGAWTLSGANTSNAGVIISAGTLKLGASGVISDLCAVTANGTLDLNGFNETIGSLVGSGTVDNSAGAGSYTLTLGGDNSNSTFSGIIQNTSGTVSVFKGGAGTLTLSGTNTFGGTLTITSGVLKLGNAGVIPDGCAVTVDGTLEMNGFDETMGTLAGGGFVDNNSGTTASTLTTGGINIQTFFTGVIRNTAQPLALTKMGNAYFLLTGNNTYSGLTTVNGGVLSIGNNAASGVLPGNCVVASGAAVRFARNDNQTYSGVISGAGQVMKVNAGIETLTGANTYTGSTMITGGALEIGNGGVTGSIVGTVAIVGGGNGSLIFNRSDNITFSGQISGSDATGSVVKNGGNTLTLGTNNFYWGSTVINAGILKLGAAGAIPDSSALVVNGNLDLNGFNETVGSISGSGIIDNNAGSGTFTLTTGVNDANSSFSGIIQNTSQTIALTKVGAGVQTLSGANTYSGPTTVSAGTLRLGAAGALPDAGAVTVNGNLDMNGFSETIGSLAGSGTVGNNSGSGTFTLTSGGNNGTTTFSGVIQNAAATVALTKTGTGIFTLSGNNNYGGQTTISAGTLKLGSTSALGGTGSGTVIASGAALDLNGINYSGAEALTLNGTGVSSAGALVNSNATGAVFAGMITLGSASSIVGQSGTINISYGGNITGAYALTLGGAQGGFFASTLGGGILTKLGAGTWTFSGSNSLSLIDLTLSAGTLNLGTGLTHSVASTLTLSGGTLDFGSSTLRVELPTVDFSSLANLIAGTGTLEFTNISTVNFTPKSGATHPGILQSGAGITYLTADVTTNDLNITDGTFDIHNYSSTLTVTGNVGMTNGFLNANSGSMHVSGNINIPGGTVSLPAPGASLTLAGSMTIGGGATLSGNIGTVILNGTVAGKHLDFTGPMSDLVVNGNGGTWTVHQNLTVASTTTISNGTLDIDSYGVSLSTDALTVNGGTLTATNGNIAVSSDFSMTSGFLSAPTTGKTFTVTGNFVQTGGTFTPAAGTVTLNGGTTGKSINIASHLNALSITGSGGAWTATGNGFNTANLSLAYGSLNLGASLTNVVGSTLTFASAPTLDFGSSTLQFAGSSLNLNGVGTLNPGTGKLEFTGTSSQAFTPKSGNNCPGIKQNGIGGTAISSYDMSTPSLTIASGILGLVSGSHSVANTVSITGGGLDFGSATLTVGAAAVDFHLLSTLTPGTGTLEFAAASTMTFTPKASAAHPALKQTSGTTTLAGDVSAAGLVLNGGTLNLGASHSHSVSSIASSGGTLVFNSSVLHVLTGDANFAGMAAVTPATGTLSFDAASVTQILIPKSGYDLPAIIHGAAGTLQLANFDLSCQGFAQSAGALDLNGRNITVTNAGDFTVSNGTPSSFANLGGQTLTVAGNASFSGASSANRINLNSGTVWTVTVTGDLTATKATLANSNASPNTGRCADCTDGGGNTNWTFGISWDGGGGDNNWGTAANWGTDALPGTSDDVVFGAGASSVVLNVSPTIHSITLMSGYSSNFNFSTNTLEVTGNADFRSTGTITAGTGTLALTGATAQTFYPKSGSTFPQIRKDGNGTLTLAGGALTAGALTINTGTVNLGTGFTHTVASVSAPVNPVTLNFNGSDLTVPGNVDMTGITVIGSGKTLTFNGPSAQTYIPDASSSDLNITKSGAGITTVSGADATIPTLALAAGVFNLGSGRTVTVTTTFTTNPGCGLDLGSSTLAVGAATMNMSGVTNFTPGTGTLKFIGSSAQSFRPKAGAIYPRIHQSGTGTTTVSTSGFIADTLQLSGTGTLSLGSVLTNSISGLIASGGTLNFATSTLRFDGTGLDFSSLSGVTAGSGTLEFTGTGAQSFTPKNGASHPFLKQNGIGGTTLNANLTVTTVGIASGILHLGVSRQHAISGFTATGGGLDFGSSTLDFSAANLNLSGLDSLAAGTGTLKFSGGSAQTFTPKAGVPHPSITQTGIGGTTVIGGNLVAQTLSPLGGMFHLGTGLTHTFAAITLGGGPYGSLDFGSSQVHVTGMVDLGNLVTLTPGTGALYFDAPSGKQLFVPKPGDVLHPAIFHNAADTLQITTNNLTAAGFTQTAGVLDFNGRNVSISGAGDFSISNGGAASLANVAGRTITVAHNAVLNGTSAANRLVISPASTWSLAVAGTLTGSYVSLAFSSATNKPGSCFDCLDNGNNLAWTFTDSSVPENVTGLAATALGGHSAQVSWTASIASDADSVVIRYRTDGVYPSGPADGTLWRSVPKSRTTDTATGLADKTVFNFAAFAKDSSGNYALAAAGARDTARTTDVTPPANMSAFTATALSPTSTALGWTGSASLDADTVMIRVRSDGAYPADTADGTLFKKVSSQRSADTATGLTAGRIYWFAAFVRDSSGNYCAASSSARDTSLNQAAITGSIAINDASGRTRDSDPALAFTYSGADSMRFSLAADTASSAWTATHGLDSLNMAPGPDGMRIALAQFKNTFGTRSPWYRDTTQLDRTGPVTTLSLMPDQSWRNWPGAVTGRSLDAIAGTDTVFVVRRRDSDGAYFNGSGWTTVSDTARIRADSTFSVPMPASAMANGSYVFTAIARDRIGNVSAPLSVHVNYLENRAPVAAVSTIADSALQNASVAWTLDIGDPDADDSVLTVTTTIPAWLSVSERADSAQGGYGAHRIYTLTGTPGQADVGTGTLTVQARDLGGKTVIFSKTFTVIDVNDAPVFASGQDSMTINEDSTSRFTPRYADADSKDSHAFAFLQAPAWASILDSTLVFRPGSRDVGPAPIRLTVSDGKSLDTLDFTVTVANVNDAPVAFPSANWQSPAHWKEDVAESFSVVVVDMDPGDPIVLATSLPAWLTYSVSVDPENAFNRFFKFAATPAQKDTGSYSFKLRFQDAVGAFSELPLAAKVASVNDTPTAVVKSRQTQAGAARIAFDVVDQDGGAASTRFHYRLIGPAGDTVRRGICATTVLDLHPLADGDYRLAVAAEDEGGLRQSGYTLSTLNISGATVLALDSARWNMIGYPGRALAAGSLGAGAGITSWDESSEDGAPLGRYASGHSADSLVRGKGYWVRVPKPVTVKAGLAELLDRPFVLKLTHSKQGWNQVGNPFPYFVDLSVSGLQFWEWDAAGRDLVNARGILKPWGAYWVQVARDTSLTVKDEPYFPNAAAPLAKGASAPAPEFRHAGDWTLQMALQAGPYQDRANFLGIRNVTGAASARVDDTAGSGASSSGLVSDAPKFGDYIALHFEKPGESAGDSLTHGYSDDFRDCLGEDEEWWDFSVENSGSGLDKANLTVPGLQALEAAGLHAFLVRKGEVMPVSAEGPAVLPMDEASTHYALVVTPHPDFAERLHGSFSISQNFPNPVTSQTAFRFFLPQTWDAQGKREAKTYRLRLNVYDFSGRLAARVADAGFKPGSHTLIWKPQAKGGGSLAKGAYVYRLEIPGFAKSLKMLVK